MTPPGPDLLRAGLAGLGWLLLLLVTVFGGHACTPAALEERLQAQVEAALAREGLDFADVGMSGQTVILEGVAPTPQARDRAAAVALRAAGPGGPWAGGVVGAQNRIEVGESVQPFVWRAVRVEDGLRLEGYAPSERVRERLVRQGRRLFGAVEDRMRLAAGAPGPGWSVVASEALDRLAMLEAGEARLTDSLLILMGEAKPEAADALRAIYRDGLAPPFRVMLDLTRPGETPEIPRLEGVDLSDGEAGPCQVAFERLLQGRVIRFDVNSAEIDAASLTLLAQLAAVARRCDRRRIEISGHTDASGDLDRNMALSLARAEAVRDHLVRLGVSPDRLSAVGFGPKRPAASNDTDRGRAANRRIEFQVVS